MPCTSAHIPCNSVQTLINPATATLFLLGGDTRLAYYHFRGDKAASTGQRACLHLALFGNSPRLIALFLQDNSSPCPPKPPAVRRVFPTFFFFLLWLSFISHGLCEEPHRAKWFWGTLMRDGDDCCFFFNLSNNELEKLNVVCLYPFGVWACSDTQSVFSIASNSRLYMTQANHRLCCTINVQHVQATPFPVTLKHLRFLSSYD